MGQHDHFGLFIERDGGDVERLVRDQRGGGAVMHHHTADDPATAAQLPPLHRGVFLTTGARWPRRELIPKAARAILDYQPLLVASVVEGLVQRIGYGGLFGHIFRPFRFQIKTAPARFASRYFSWTPPSTTLRCLPSTVACDSDLQSQPSRVGMLQLSRSAIAVLLSPLRIGAILALNLGQVHALSREP